MITANRLLLIITALALAAVLGMHLLNAGEAVTWHGIRTVVEK